MKSLILICFCLFSLEIKAQTVSFNESETVSRFMKVFCDKNRQVEEVRGWRVQLISTDDRRKMEATIAKFRNLYPNMETTWKHVVPYYQVRVGAYDKKLKCLAFLKQIKENFPTATPVADNIPKSYFIR